ncbi:unnamed protein product [Brassicogethes aeneus]|uniref:C2H2-type domain-containing protein n=1 Tax=Brassicogethes aeneus TaxID=1431903 RepID=A0A9P0B907_BRAAE|nr:unnamed protein product [Brassicogethes aeneus]
MPFYTMKNYANCPLKKRPVFFYDETVDEPENLSTKPEDLSRTDRLSPSSIPDSSPASPQSLETSSPHHSPARSTPSPVNYYQAPIKPEVYPEYSPETWHRSVAPVYPQGYHFMYPYHQQEYLPHYPAQTSPIRPTPLQPLALRPNVYANVEHHHHHHAIKQEVKPGIRHECPDCSKVYSTHSGLTKHRQFHCSAGEAPKKTFNCNYCEKLYTSMGALKMHIRTHTLPCKCTICGKAFSRPWLLQGHIRTHTGEKPFSCNFCNRAFADRSNLRAHLQTHSEVKKYSCTKCSKSFSRVSLLTKHTETGCNGCTAMMM